MSKESSQEKISEKIRAIQEEEEREKAKKDMEELSELPDEEFEEEKRKTIEELGIPEDRAEGFLKSSKDFRKSKKN